MEPTEMTMRFPDPIEGPWSVRLWIGNPSGYPTVVGVEMWGVDPKLRSWGDEPRRGLPDVAVTATAIRLPLKQMLEAWLAFFRPLTDAAIEQLEGDPVQRRVARGLLDDLYVPGPRGGRKRLNPEFLAEVARVYRDAVARGVRSPALAVWEWAKAQDMEIQESTARGWIRRAGEQGFLPKGRPGKVRTEEGT